MVLDVFHPWPRDALIGVAERFMVVLEKNIPKEVGTKSFSNLMNFHQNSQKDVSRFIKSRLPSVSTASTPSIRIHSH